MFLYLICSQLIYFGGIILHTTVQVKKSIIELESDFLTYPIITTNDLEYFWQQIDSQIKNVSKVLDKDIKRSGFKRLSSDQGIYIFQYPNPAPRSRSHEFSHINLSSLIINNLIEVKEMQEPISGRAQLDHCSHMPLEMFQRSKQMAHRYYSSQLASPSLSNGEKKELEDLIAENNEYYLDHSCRYVERNWTERLFIALKMHCKHLKPRLTLHDASGGGFAKKILSVWAHTTLDPNSVPFRGAPDLTTDYYFVLVMSDNLADEADESTLSDATDTSPIEIANEKLSIAQSTTMCPEKLGELVSAMMTKGYCSMVKDLVYGEEVKTEYIVYGTLIDKFNSEAILCTLTMPCLLGGRRSCRNTPKLRSHLQVQIQCTSTVSELCQALNYFVPSSP